MLKTLIFFLFGCSLYFGQSSGVSALTLEGDGTKTTSTSGQGSGSGNNLPNLLVVQNGNNLIVSLNRPEAKFNSYSLYNGSGMAIFEDRQIRPANSYSIDMSNLKPGHYFITVEVITPTFLSISRPFIKL